MARKSLTVLIAGLVVCGMIFTVSCTKEIKPEGGDHGTTDIGSSGCDDSGMSAKDREDKAIQKEMQRAREAFVNEDVHFDFDQSVLTPMARGVLERKAAWLRSNPGAAVTIEGHCDERGTADYNIALGERRANSAKSFLIDLGISASRLRTVSYGEERPLDPSHNESAWAKNRRAHFIIR